MILNPSNALQLIFARRHLCYDKDCLAYRQFKYKLPRILMKQTHSFNFVTFVKDVIFTSGEETSNISFQVPADLLAFLTLSNYL